ncbi:unnamed protein product [Gadus morhua 'NCC']
MAISEKRRGLCVVQRAAAEQVQKHASFTWRSGVRVSQLYGLPSHRIYTTDNTNNTNPVTVSTYQTGALACAWGPPYLSLAPGLKQISTAQAALCSALWDISFVAKETKQNAAAGNPGQGGVKRRPRPVSCVPSEVSPLRCVPPEVSPPLRFWTDRSSFLYPEDTHSSPQAASAYKPKG